MEIKDNTLFEAQNNIGQFHFENIEKLFAQSSQKEIIDSLSQHKSLDTRHMAFVLDLAFQKQFSEVITYIKNTFGLYDKDLILYADETGNIEWIKQFIQFDNYIDITGRLKKIDLIDYLYSLGLNGAILDKIFIYDGINYLDTNGTRYLQTLIRANHQRTYTSIILEFIELAMPEELNAQELDGSTPLFEIAKQWEKASDQISMEEHQSILEALLNHGADIEITDNDQKKFSETLFFQFYPNKCRNLQESAEAIKDKFVIMSSNNREFCVQFYTLVAKKDQSKMIEFLLNRPALTNENLSYIFEVALKSKSLKVLNFLEESYEIDLKDQIICAAHLDDIEKLKQLTFFNKFVSRGRLDKKAYLAQLKILGVPEFVLDKIIAHDGINYLDTEGHYYLQAKIRAHRAKHPLAIIEFIESAYSEQLNTQELYTKSTALHEAAMVWEKSREALDKEEMAYQKAIIETLLRKGADPTLPNIEGVKPINLSYFSTYDGHWQKIQTEDSSMQPKQRISNSKAIKPKAPNLILDLALVSILGLTALYISHKTPNRNHFGSICSYS